MPGYTHMRLPEEYRWLHSVSARDLAWEWLRRNEDFRRVWNNASSGAMRSSARAETAIIRSRRPAIAIPEHPLAKRWTHWGLSFAPDPDTPAHEAAAIAWLPTIDPSVLTVVRPMPGARTMGEVRFRPSTWGDRRITITADGGTHLLIMARQTVRLSLWLPNGLAPQPGSRFGLYLHADQSFTTRTRAVNDFRRAANGIPLQRSSVYANAGRQAVMLFIHDRLASNMSLVEIASELFDPPPSDWRMSSERSDLRRLADAAKEMVAGGYRRLLGS